MVVLPNPVAVTTPEDTVATDGSNDVQVASGVTSFVDPSANLAVAVRAPVCPTAVSDRPLETVTALTAGVTFTFTEIDLVRYVALIVVLPNATDRTRPVGVTDATAGLFELHVASVATWR